MDEKNSKDTKKNCPICLHSISDESKVHIAVCNHSMCKNCFESLIKCHQNKCPECNKEFVEYEIFSDSKVEKMTLTQNEIDLICSNKKDYANYLNGMI